MFGLGLWEFLVVAIVALIVLGPRKIPELGRQLGKMLREVRRASNEFKRSLDEIDVRDDLAKTLNDPADVSSFSPPIKSPVFPNPKPPESKPTEPKEPKENDA